MSAAIIAQAGAGLLSSFIQGVTSGQSQNAGPAQSTNASTGVTTGHHHHHHGADLDKLVSALSSALQSNSSGGSVDVNKTITDALTKIFQTGSLGSTGQADTDGDTDGSTAASTTDPATSPTNSTGIPDKLAQLLKNFGVTPQQFESDVNSAIQSAQASGQFDPSVLLKSFPPGSVVDTTG
jgi:hypothetical protein